MRKDNNKGSALVAVLIVLVVMSILGFGLLNVSLAENKFAIHQESRTKAYYIARAGAEATATWVADKNHVLGTIETLLLNNEVNNYVWTDFEDGKFKISFPGTDKYAPTIQSVGEYNGIQRTLSISLTKRYFFDAAVTALNKLNIENYSNCVIIGDVAIAPDAEISPPNGNHIIEDVITGSIGTTTRIFPPIVDPDLTLTEWTSTNTISSGDSYENHSFETVNLGSATLDINLTGDMQIQFESLEGNNATINVNGTGNLIIYADTVNFRGNLHTSSTATTTLMIFKAGSVNFQSGNSDFQAFIYAPEATIDVYANFGSVGAVIANIVNLKSGGTIAYDEEALGNVYPEELGFLSEGYDHNLWIE